MQFLCIIHEERPWYLGEAHLWYMFELPSYMYCMAALRSNPDLEIGYTACSPLSYSPRPNLIKASVNPRPELRPRPNLKASVIPRTM